MNICVRPRMTLMLLFILNFKSIAIASARITHLQPIKHVSIYAAIVSNQIQMMQPQIELQIFVDDWLFINH